MENKKINKTAIYQNKYRHTEKGKLAVKNAILKYSRKPESREKRRLKYLENKEKLKKYDELMLIV